MNNPNYIPYLQHERHQIIDTVIETSAEALQLPEIAVRLGSHALELENLLHYTTIPNLHHGEIVSADTRGDCTEMLALHTNELVSRRYRDLMSNAIQAQR